jgi:hypothetical protein
MKSTGIIRNAITSNLPLELAYREPAVSGQRATYVAEQPAFRPSYRSEIGYPAMPENRIEFAQLLSM